MIKGIMKKEMKMFNAISGGDITTTIKEGSEFEVLHKCVDFIDPSKFQYIIVVNGKNHAIPEHCIDVNEELELLNPEKAMSVLYGIK